MTSTSRHVTFFHNPRSRSVSVRVLVEELQADVEIRPLKLDAGETHTPGYLAINPMGKVPAIVHDGHVVTEQVAIIQYLAELYPEAALSPAVGDRLRGPYLRWIAFYGACFEPALLDRALQRPPVPPSTAGWADFDTTFATLEKQLSPGPWLLGDRFTAADVLWGTALAWTTQWKMIPERASVQAYLERFEARPAVKRARAADDELARRLE